MITPETASPRSAVAGIEWPAIAAPVGASLLALQFQLDRSQWWSPERLLENQLQQLKKLIEHAVKKTDWYAADPVWREIANQQHPLTQDQLSTLPILQRRDLQNQLPALTATNLPKAHGQLIELATSGSTGTPLKGWETELNQFFWGGFTLRNHLWHNHNFDGKFAAIRTRVGRQTLPNWGPAVSAAFTTGPAVTLGIDTPIGEQAAWLADQQPDYLISHASNLKALAHYSINYKTRLESLNAVISFGERPADGLDDLIGTAWGARFEDIYSAEELGTIALQCPDQPQNYHVMAEHLLVELLDTHGKRCQPGAAGRVVVTALHNFAMPLIRYELGDYARLGSQCTCGRGLPVLTEILGRARNMITLPDGSQHWPSFPAELWLAVAPIRQFQLEQRKLDEITAHYLLDRPLTRVEEKELAARLTDSLRFPGTIVFRQHTRPLSQAGRKFEDFVSRL
ncbi:MAG TPA: phenylacetate--CoA ligase family protein [Gammaproteobacteria bacterium]|nr:phenylacetate--CoA ligase family protein [Gammaproteobacteria bacterium]